MLCTGIFEHNAIYSFYFQRMEARMSQLVAAQEAYKKARNEWAAQVLLSEFLYVDYLLPGLYSYGEERFLPDSSTCLTV